MWNLIQSFLQKNSIKKHIALMPIDNKYLCAAMNVSKNTISFEGFAQEPLTVLTKQYRDYALSLSLPNEAIVSKTWIYPLELSRIDIYQNIAKQAFSKAYASFDIEVLEENHDAKKQVILAHFLTQAHWKYVEETYIARGFKIHQLVPMAQLNKHFITEAWQREALEERDPSTGSSPASGRRPLDFANALLTLSTETCLKLLYRASAYEH